MATIHFVASPKTFEWHKWHRSGEELCNKWKNGQDCVLGRACPYAHGEKELGTVELVVCGRVKTRICKFWTTGNCRWAQFTGESAGESIRQIQTAITCFAKTFWATDTNLQLDRHVFGQLRQRTRRERAGHEAAWLHDPSHEEAKGRSACCHICHGIHGRMGPWSWCWFKMV